MLKVFYHYILSVIQWNRKYHINKLYQLRRSEDEDTSVGAHMALVKLGVEAE